MDVPVAIVGGGVVGLSAAWALAKRGVGCAVFDPLPRRTEFNASNDESKVFRIAYAEREDYSRLALEALPGWKALEQASRRTLLLRHGLLMLGRDRSSFAARSHATLERLGRAPQWLDGPALESAHPAFRGAGYPFASLDREGGLLDPPAVLEALEAEAVARGARIHRGRAVLRLEQEGAKTVCVLEHGRVRAERVLVAAGHRAPLLLPELAPVLRCTRQPEFLYTPAEPHDYEAPRLPVFAAFEDGCYGFPLHRGAVKVADHRKGAEVQPEPPWNEPTPAEEAPVRAFLRRCLPGLAAAPLARSRLCHYDNTPDDDFLLGPHPGREGVLLALGFSGHGYKFAPALGERLADLATGRVTDPPLPALDPARLL